MPTKPRKKRVPRDAIEAFDTDDYERLREINPDDIQHITRIPPSYQDIAAALQALINAEKLYLMDKESGVAFPASVVIGFKGDGLLLANER